MHGEPLKANETDRSDAELDLRVVQALERVLEVEIPVDFASRVVGRLPARRMATMRAWKTTRFGYWAMVTSLVVISVAMLMLARTMSHGTLWVGVQWMLCAQFVVLILGLSVWRGRIN